MNDQIAAIVDGDEENWYQYKKEFENKFKMADDKVSSEEMYQALIKGYTSSSLYPVLSKKLATGDF